MADLSPVTSVSAYGGEDLEAHAAFQQAAFRARFTIFGPARVQTAAYYAWKYATPAGAAVIARTCSGGVLAAVAAASPAWFRINGTRVRVYQIADLASAPSMRGKGLFRRSLVALLDALPIGEPAYCLPNRRSLPLLLNAGFRPLPPMKVWLTPAGKLPARMRDPAPGTGLDLLDSETFAWRFEARPGTRYRTAFRGGEGALAARSIRVGPATLLAVIGLRGSVGFDEPARLAGHALLWIGHAHPPWTGALKLPLALLPRAFPVLVRHWMGDGATFQGAEWDVP